MAYYMKLIFGLKLQTNNTGKNMSGYHFLFVPGPSNVPAAFNKQSIAPWRIIGINYSRSHHANQ